jgi:hypothetical protein
MDRPAVFVLLALCTLPVACRDKPAPAVPDSDPALAAALDAPLLTDPDLAALNRANSVAAKPPISGMLPTLDNGPDAVAAARAEALALVGGAERMRSAPEPREEGGPFPPGTALSAAARAAATPGADAACARRASYTLQWAARMPAAFPVYPRAATQEAAGSDEGRCRLRVVDFVTPVPLGDVMDFYFTRALAAGFSAERTLQDGDDVLAGRKGAAAYAVYARRLPSGNTQVDLVTSGV